MKKNYILYCLIAIISIMFTSCNLSRDVFDNGQVITIDAAEITGQISNLDDIIYYKFTLEEGKTYYINTTQSGSVLVDTYIKLYDSSKTVIEENDDQPKDPKQPAGLHYTAAKSGLYYLTVKAMPNSDISSFGISITKE